MPDLFSEAFSLCSKWIFSEENFSSSIKALASSTSLCSEIPPPIVPCKLSRVTNIFAPGTFGADPSRRIIIANTPVLSVSISSRIFFQNCSSFILASHLILFPFNPNHVKIKVTSQA